LLLLIQVMDEINPAARERLARDIITTITQGLPDCRKPLWSCCHSAASLVGREHALFQSFVVAS